MRLRFLQDQDGTVYQYLVPFEDRDIELRDFSRWNEKDAHNEMRKWTAVPFKRFHSPMNQIVLIKLPNGYNGIYFKADHMTMDSSSIPGCTGTVLCKTLRHGYAETNAVLYQGVGTGSRL